MTSQVLEHTDSARPSIDCRVYERQSCALPTTCQPASVLAMKEQRWAATIVDISQGGVRVKLQRRFERGTGLAVELPGDAARESAVVFVKVVHVKSQDDGTWALGCKFVSELSDDEVHRLVTSDDYVLSSTKREDPTGAYEEHDEIDNDEPAPAPAPVVTSITEVGVEILVARESPIRCWIKRLDVSKCWPLTPGKSLNIGGKAKDGTIWSIKLEVIQLSQKGEGWQLQSRLAQPAAASGLMRVLGRLNTRPS